MSDDYDPIVKTGSVEVRGLDRFSWLLERRMPTAGHGQQLVVTRVERRQPDGRALPHLANWALVDVTEHLLDVRIPITDPHVAATFVATVSFGVRVENAGEFVISGARRPRAYVEPVIRRTVKDLLVGLPWPEKDVPAFVDLGPRKQVVEDRLSELEHRKPESIEGFLVRIASVQVEPDPSTAEHQRDLWSRRRQLEMNQARAAVEAERASQDLTIRRMYREQLAPLLLDPTVRVLEAVLENPSSENIRCAITQLAEREREQQAVLRQLLSTLLEGNYLDIDRQDQAAIVGLIRGLSFPADTGTRSASEPAHPGLEAMGTDVPAEHGDSDYQSAMDQVSATIFLDTNDAIAAAAFERAVRDVLAEHGLDLEPIGEPILRSWFRAFRIRARDVATSDEVARRLEKVEHAIELSHLHQPMSIVNINQSEAIGRLAVAAQDVDNFVALAGSLLFVKATSGDRVDLFTRTLSVAEVREFENNRRYLTNPAQVVAYLREQDAHGPDGPSERQGLSQAIEVPDGGSEPV